MPRAGETDVRDIIQTRSDYRIEPFLEAAEGLTDHVESEDTLSILSIKQLKSIETYLAAHFYAHRDQQYKNKRTDGAGAAFQVGADGTGSLDTTQWGRTAMALDVTGTLSRINEDAKHGKATVDFAWLGKPKSEQIEYQDRD